MRRLNVLAVMTWLIVGSYGIFFNQSYIDEAKYLIKGWLIVTGQVGYYSTPEFFYQHLPGSLLWFGIGQKLFGPSLLAARIQAFILGLVTMWLSYLLAKKISPQAGRRILPILSLAPVAILYYSSAVPASLAAVFLLAGFLGVFSRKFYLATIGFSLAFIVRENFSFTLFFYFLWLYFYLNKRGEWFKNILVSAAVAGLFLFPGWPGTVATLKNLNLNQGSFPLSLYFQAAKEFCEIYFVFIIIFIWAFRQKKFLSKRFVFLIFITAFNFLAHAWAAAHLSPRNIVPNFAYIFPLAGVIMAVLLAERKINRRFFLILMLAAQGSVIFSSIFQPPAPLNNISQFKRSGDSLKLLVEGKNNIVWLAEPLSLYLAGRVSYFPLINHTNFYRFSSDTRKVGAQGFWNEPMMLEWLDRADLVAVEPRRLKVINSANIENKLAGEFDSIDFQPYVWPGNIIYYQQKND